MIFNPEFHYRQSIRIREYDYSQAGAYFVTICVKDKECLFGEIRDGGMILNGFGKIVENEWLRTEVIRNNAELDLFVVMPNHFHGILVLNNGLHMHDENVGARRCLAHVDRKNESRATHRVAPTLNAGFIGAIIGQFKSIVTKQINQIRNAPAVPVWQRNYYEHIIRNETELDKIREYIIGNPMNWLDDENYIGRPTGSPLQ